ncbi:hypothetical protein PR202_gb03485 [Eleusine coracana subsp. coracana]|uniref:non-specific serine/threonine protein kinase n=1 Tax=Eleusine coracana subsp. coracana TaxID=191504 RepID=A0AAV5E120_ELECO|nr:hypothetical protein PR202_gb03485 [Eleusine coracana subsp. coracana]
MAAISSRPSLLVLSCLYCFALLTIHVHPAGSLSFNLRFSQPQSPDIAQLIGCTGDAFISPETLELTRNRRDQSSTNSTGRAKYKRQVRLWDAATGEIASFTTTFSFKTTLDPSTQQPGDGMAFFLAHFDSDIPADSEGGGLGLLPPVNGTGNSSIIAVEFDTFSNRRYADISSSHVAIDINSLNSTASTDTTSQTKNLTSGYTMVATIRYENTTKLLDVDLRINDTSYKVTATVDLREYLPEHVAVGFSAASEQHQLVVCGEDRPAAIKMFSSESSAQGRKEFEAEVRIISRLKRRNLVQLLGWCDSRKGLLLVYELVAEGSLDKHLSSSNKRLHTWPERYQIILGLGWALRYLHHEWEQCVVHGDIKPSNIMLDDSLRAKLGDFGLARLGEHGARWHTTKAVLGTAGYIDPEFVNTRHPSIVSDVYSFGIALLEIASGRPPVILQDSRPPFILLKWVWSLYGRNAILDAADERLMRGDELDEKRMERVLVVGLWCAHPDQSERPSIAEAMQVLQSEDARLPALTPQMYKTVTDFAVAGRAYGALSIESYSGGSSTTTTGDSKLSSGSSTTALLRDSNERA